ncbi:response regulator transcription factor [Streptomyces sp. GXMU-J15]|uniref:Response regulator transcription factor n=1 Tax=Streptomyces fuscus TaxID=3048495 RepID=A0ABT7JBG5_9ACTN|nr:MULTISPECIES: response regulator transcription factor [Streptomyces]MDL2082218.1 response regulator transcription factor [Streptomyces fuscus]
MIRRVDMGAVRDILREASLALKGHGVVRVAWCGSADSEFSELCSEDIVGTGRELRLLWHREAARSAAGRHLLRRLLDAGAVVRFASAPPPNMIMLGGETGVVRTEGRPGERRALLFQHAEVVEPFRRMYSALWEQAAASPAPAAPPLPSAPPPPPPPAAPPGFGPTAERHSGALSRITADAVQSQVLRLLCSGVKDEAAARQMGVCVRTYRRYVARILKSLDVTSRFQAGIRAAELGLVAHSTS